MKNNPCPDRSGGISFILVRHKNLLEISRLRYASLEMRVGVVSMLRFALGKGAVRSIDCRLNKSTFILTEVEKSAYVSTIYNIILGLIEKFYKKTQEKNL